MRQWNQYQQTSAPILHIIPIAALLAALLTVPGQVAAQSNPFFRDLGARNTPTPQQLFQRLSKYRELDDTAIYDRLQTMGRDVFESLSPEQRDQAKQFAEQLIRNQGLNSESAKSLMERMGIPDEAQQDLIKEYLEQSDDQGQPFKQQQSQRMQKKLQQLAQQSGIDLDELLNRNADTGSSQPKTGGLQNRSRSSSNTNDDSIDEVIRQIESLTRPGSQPDNNRRRVRSSDDANPTAGDSTRDSVPDNDRRPDLSANENRRRPGSESESESQADAQWAKQFYDYASKALPEIKRSIARGELTPETFDPSLLDKIKDYANRTSSNQRPSTQSPSNLEKLFKQGAKALNQSGNQDLKEKIEARFDRLLVDAATSSVQAAADDEGKSMFNKAFDKLLDSGLDVAQDALDKKKRKRNSRSGGGNSDVDSDRDDRQSGASPVSDIASNNRNSNENKDSPGASPVGGPQPTASSASSDFEWGAFFDRIQWPAFFAIAGILGLACLLIFWWKSLESNEEQTHRKRLLKSLRGQQGLRSPKDLVDAVDLYLIAQHGPNAGWWDEGRAESVVAEQRPQLKDKISRLFATYSESRYSAESQIDSQSRQQSEQTLRELVAAHHVTSGHTTEPVVSEGQG